MMEPQFIDPHDPMAAQAIAALRSGDAEALRRLLARHPQLVYAHLGDRHEARTLLHVVTDYPGDLPRAADSVDVLLQAGAVVDAPFVGRHSETALHWAASTDAVEVLDRLLDAGAGIEAGGGVVGNGTPLADAVAFGQWRAARRLVARGARCTLWQAAALGLEAIVDDLLAQQPPPDEDAIGNAFWCACHGGQRATAERLLERGAALDQIRHDGLSPLEAAQRSGHLDLVEWLRARGARSRGEAP